MKKTIIFTLFLFGFEVISYAQNNSTILKVDTVSQKGVSSCWVSSTKMLLNYFGDTNRLDTITCLNTHVANPNKIPTIKFSDYSIKILTANKLKINAYSLSRNYASNSDYDQQKKLFLRANIVKQDSLPWTQMMSALKTGPMILWKEMGLSSSGSHIVVLNGYEHQFSEKYQLRWISVKDPWPVNKASEYLITYEFYKKKNKLSAALTLENPRNALFYSFKVNNITTGRVLASSLTAIPSGKINIITKVSSNPTLMRDSVALQAQKTVNHLSNYSSSNVKSSFGLNQTGLNVDKTNMIRLRMINFTGGGVKTTYTENNSLIPKEAKWLKGVSLFDADDTYLVNVKKNSPTAVISMGITQNNELYTTHLEKYGSSMAQVVHTVLANVMRPPAPNNDITEAYFHRSYDSGLQDFLIVNPNSEKPVLVDLFSKMDEFQNPDKSVKAGVFDLKIHTLEGAKLSQFETYILPVTKTCEQNSPITECPNKVSEAGRMFFQSYQNIISKYHKLILKNPDTLSSLEAAGCGYIIDYFTISSNNFSRITNADSISFASSFNYLEAPNYKNMFITPLIDDSYYIYESKKYVNAKPDSAIASLKYANQAYNSERCFPWPKNFKYSAFGYRQDSLFVQTIFVPVITYKLFQNKKNDDSDFEYLQNYAVNPKEIITLGNPLLESNEGYLSTINTTLKQNINEQKSITGVICTLKLKNNQTVQCYVFNRESFGKSNPFVSWKVKR